MKTQHPDSAQFVTLPDWVKPTVPDVAAFFSALALADLEGGWIRLRAADQRALLGCVPFGQCAIKSDGGAVKISRSVCFGTDHDGSEYSAAELAARIKCGESCRPGVYAKLKK